MDFGVHPGRTRKPGIGDCCYVCECPFVPVPGADPRLDSEPFRQFVAQGEESLDEALRRMSALGQLTDEDVDAHAAAVWVPDLEPIDNRPCVPTAAYRRRQRLLPLLNVWYLFLIFATQGPRVWSNRFMWWLCGDAYNSGCRMCGGSGKYMLPYVPPGDYGWGPSEGQKAHEVPCSSCNGFHD